MRSLRWNIVLPVALFASTLLAIGWFDVTTGGDAEPPPLLADVGTPVRGTFVPPPTRPPDAKPTAEPRPTFAGQLAGTPEQRDERRRNDLLLLVFAANQIRDAEGEYPTTAGNLQTVCVYEEHDVGCGLRDVLDVTLPEDPRGKNFGYWYASDGESVTVYATLEEEAPEAQACETSDPNLLEHGNIICVTVP